MSDQNFVSIDGRLARDPELAFTQTGKPVCKFCVAVNEKPAKEGQQPKANFFEVKCWNKVAEEVSAVLKKGHPVTVKGKLEQERWTNQNTQKENSRVIIVANVVAMPLFNKSGAAHGVDAPAAAPSTTASATTPEDDDVPF